MARPKKLVSLFSGALGLDIGLENAGFELCTIVECDPVALETAKANIDERSVHIISQKMDLDNIDSICESIMKKNKLKPGELDLLAGAPPCQPFSTAGKRQSISDVRGDGFSVFFRSIKKLKPKYFIIENVKGILSAALKHRPLSQRGSGFPPLSPEEEYGSAFYRILNELGDISKELGYCSSWGVLNSADFGAPQSRERLIIIGSLDGKFIWPEKTHSKTEEGKLKKWNGIGSVIKELKEEKPEYRDFNATTKNYLKLIPEGGNWRDLPSLMHEEAIGGAYRSWGGRSGFLRRLSYGKASPTITQSPSSKATMLCHPTETRPLSVGECARIQQFPDYWIFCGGLAAKYKQIGNATPIGLAEVIGLSIIKSYRRKGKYKSKLVCAQEGLLERIISRPKTMLNPPRMRKVSDPEKTNKWLKNNLQTRGEFSKFEVYGNLKS